MNEFSFLRRTYLSFALWCFPTSSARKLMIHLEYWMKWNEILALWIVILFIHHSADNYTSCLLLVCALVSSDFFIWSSWSFSKFSTPLFLTLYRCWWRELRFRWIKWSVIMIWFKIYSFRCVLVLTERKMHI